MPNYAQAAIQVRQNKERRAKGKDSQKPIVKNVNLTRGEILRFYKDEKQVMERGGGWSEQLVYFWHQQDSS